MPEIPFPRAKILKIFRRTMPSKPTLPHTGDRLRGTVSRSPFSKILYPPQNSLHLARKYARIFVRGNYLFRARSKQFSRRKRYLSIFSRQVEAIVFIIHQIFFETLAVLKIGIFPSFSLSIFTFI